MDEAIGKQEHEIRLKTIARQEILTDFKILAGEGDQSKDK